MRKIGSRLFLIFIVYRSTFRFWSNKWSTLVRPSCSLAQTVDRALTLSLTRPSALHLTRDSAWLVRVGKTLKTFWNPQRSEPLRPPKPKKTISSTNREMSVSFSSSSLFSQKPLFPVSLWMCVYFGFELTGLCICWFWTNGCCIFGFELMGTAAEESFWEPKSIWVMEKSTDCEEICGQSRRQEGIFW